jgi:hypothetical protein
MNSLIVKNTNKPRYIFTPRLYRYIKQISDKKEKINTFLYQFDPVFVLFLYATTHDRQEMIDNLKYVYYSKSTFFDQYSNWTLTLTPTEQSNFKSIIIECLNNYKLKEFPDDKSGFSIYFFLVVHPELLVSLITLINDNVIIDINQRCMFGNTSIMWAKFYECDIVENYLKNKCVLEVINYFGETTNEFIENNKEKL